MDATYGALVDGIIISLILFGVTCGQVIQYYRTYPKDSLYLKMDTLHSVLLVHACWHYLILRITYEELETANWSLIVRRPLLFYSSPCAHNKIAFCSVYPPLSSRASQFITVCFLSRSTCFRTEPSTPHGELQYLSLFLSSMRT
ncbi:hypothetical protein DFH11DRAFT_78183 [Phellopilus nigrolimitatus]|nr:hypothetical protein DFH11DRAFT_78183 [Phellopilus nigrolimitatus]